MSNLLQGWTCTDPNNFQFRRKISEKVYEFKEFDLSLLNPATTSSLDFIKDKEKLSLELFVNKYWNQEELWFNEEIDLNLYEDGEIREALDTYGYEYEEGLVIYPNGDSYTDDALIAECLFEQETQY